ncbi:MAG: DNA topoisomerase 3 [Gemmiger sp.]|uniref:DNA topoisomerase 3 n=1 Tax=Gemmiger sp. TaxID=2049027 RepID=UPI002E76483F|nr:DNA topoisomerase 3 [Gemmiger sp.]MEE0708611.1 DNA topoisomerase 3 [Gemmiger sp.]
MTQYKLVIAEKPSVARSIAGVIGAMEKHDGYLEGNGYLVSWCIGHLVSFADAGRYDERFKKWRYEDLPILPEPWQYIIPDDKKQQFDVLRSLMQRPDVTGLVCATDAGREGELIFRFVYQMAGCEKPFERLWISSMEDSAIKDGFAHLKPGRDYDPLYQSALCRAKADWLIGINATRLFSVLYHKTLTVGRVQTPTLKMLVDRDAKITDFKKEKYHIVHIAAGGADAVSSRFSDAAEANTVKTACAGAQAVCASVTREKKTEQPPKLYDLTTLQREANRLFGFTAKQTLDYAQTLYEKKLLTYPRTDSQYLTDDMLPTVESLVSGLWDKVPFAKGLNISPQFDRILNSKKVSDHHAIIPTAEFAKQGFDALAESERKLLSLICCKLLCAVAGPHIYEAVTATFTCAGKEFTAKGKTVLSPGWKEIDRRFRSSLKTDSDEEAEAVRELPELCEGQTFADVAASVTEHFTTPPKPYTEDTLLSAMERAGAEDMPEDAERKGLGTPATRAAILEKLVQMGFVQRKGKQLIPTKDGINLAVVLPDALTSPQLTAEWESRLTEIAKGQADPDEFMDGIEAQARELVKTYSCISEEKQKLFQAERVVIGTCPRCGEAVYEGKKNYYCGNRACQFVMWKNDRFFEERKKAFTPKIAAALLKNGKVKVKGLYSVKTGKTYDGTVLLADTGGKYVNYRIERKS